MRGVIGVAITIAIAAGTAALLIIGTLARWDPACVGIDEKRALLPHPEFSWEALWSGKLFRSTDNFLNDRIAFRSCLIWSRNAEMWALFRKSADNHITGSNGMTFYRFIAQNYLATEAEKFPAKKTKDVLERIRSHPQSAGKRFIFLNFRNKEYLYRKYLPAVWRDHLVAEDQLPFPKVLRELEASGWTSIDPTPVLKKLADKGVAVYSQLQEHHPSPEAYFHILRHILSQLARMNDVKFELPRDFEREISPRISDGEPYLDHFYVRPRDQSPAPWAEVVKGVGPDGHTAGTTFVYQGQLDAPLPPILFYGDSNPMVMLGLFGKQFLPYFRNLIVHWNQNSLRGWDEADTVIISFTDQFSGAESFLEYIYAALEQRQKESPR